VCGCVHADFCTQPNPAAVSELATPLGPAASLIHERCGTEVRIQHPAYGHRRPRACQTSTEMPGRSCACFYPLHQAAEKRPRMKAPATSATRSTTTKIKPIGTKTTSAALPVVVECISRIPTTARYNP
jgi:hypothetical protein